MHLSFYIPSLFINNTATCTVPKEHTWKFSSLSSCKIFSVAALSSQLLTQTIHFLLNKKIVLLYMHSWKKWACQWEDNAVHARKRKNSSNITKWW